MSLRPTFILFALFLPGHRSSAQLTGDGTVVRGTEGQELDRYLVRAGAFGMGAAVLVAREGEIVLAKGYGTADTESGRPITPESLFYAASITKQFTAAAIMLLVEQEKLRVTDPLGDFFPEAPADKSDITVHQLLTHSSGITNYFSSESSSAGDRDAWVRGLFGTPLDFAPGSRATYSNAGFSLLAAIVEVVSGEPYRTFVHQHLLAPAGLTSTAFADETALLDSGRLAYGIGGGIVRDPRQYGSDWGDLGASGVVTSVLDLWKWELALRGDRILHDSSKELMWNAYMPLVRGIDYGYGWRLQKTGCGGRVIWASGNDRCYSAMYRRYLDDHLTVLFLSNVAHYGLIDRDILLPSSTPWNDGVIGRIAVGEAYELPPWFLEQPPAPLANYAGDYQLEDGGVIHVEAGNGDLRIEPHSQSAADLFLSRPAGSTMPSNDSINARVRSALESPGAVTDGDYGLGRIREEGQFHPLPLDRLGRLGAVEWVVTLPVTHTANEHLATTFAMLRFEHGNLPMTWRWDGADFYGRDMGFPLGLLPPFRAQTADRFVSYYLPMSRALQVRFELDGVGRATAIVIPHEGGAVVARRAK